MIWAAGGVPGGHSLYVKDGRLRYTFNWIGTTLQDVVADRDLTVGRPRLHRRVRGRAGRAPTRPCPARPGTLTLYVDDQAVGSGDIVTQPGYFCLTGDGICVGRDSAVGGHARVPGAVPVHRRHDRQGRGRRLRRALRRPRGPGARLVLDRLSVLRARPDGKRGRREGGADHAGPMEIRLLVTS